MKIYQFTNLLKENSVLHGISTSQFSTMKNTDGSINRINLVNFTDQLNISKNTTCMGQVHGNDVSIVDISTELFIDNVDGLITNQKNRPLCVVTADCLPILFFDKKNKVIGVAHAGRKGLESGIVQSVLKRFKNDFGSDLNNILVGIGPGIEEKCYEVDGGLMNIKKNAFSLLLGEGIKSENIESIDICTKCNNDLYSYRGGDINKRFATVISLV